ncbi:MAG: hypothetical protein U1C71_02680, partial [archaeon]|nr:hypothetical protein [archaeon]
HYNIITRKLALGKKPGSIPDADFIRAFLSISTMNPVCGIIVQNSVGGVTDKVVIRASTISRALIDQLDEGQLLEVFKKCQHIIKKNSKNKVAAEISKVLFTLRGLPPNPSADQLWNFARKHSTFAKWQASRAKIKRRKK